MSNQFIHYNTITDTNTISNLLNQFDNKKCVKFNGIVINRSPAVKVFSKNGYVCTNCGISADSASIVLDTKSNTYGLQLFCSDQQNRLTMDHIIPKSLGGGDSINNLAPMCRKCNLIKKDNILIDNTIPNILTLVAMIKVLITIHKPTNISQLRGKPLLKLKHKIFNLMTIDDINKEHYNNAFALGFYELKNNTLISSLNQSKIIL